MLAPILVRKLNSASEPTARIGGTPKPKIRIGSSKTPPPTPVIPMRVPTPKPTRLLISRSMTITACASWSLVGVGQSLSRFRGRPDEAFPLQVQNDLLRCLFGGKLACVNGDFGVGRNFVRIRDASEFLENSGARFGIQPFALPSPANIDRRGDVHQKDPAVGLNHLAHVLASRVVRRDRSANSDAA